jgi:parallel beta-helix repeat protein
MHKPKRIVAALCFPIIAWLGAACDRTETPTEARPTAAALLAANDPPPTTHWVNVSGPYAPPGTSCTHPGYPTVQSAVNAAAAGDRINVCPGTYTEQVTLPAGKDNILLRSVVHWQAVIKAPPDNPLDLVKAIVRVNGAQGVTILAFTITGPGSGGCNSLRYGVRVDNGGSADILGNHITDIRDAPPPPTVSGCQNGVAILVGRQFEMTTGSARIIGNVIENYQKNGPTVDNAGSHAEIAHNRILGVGPTATNAQNGVQVSRGATAEISHNFIAGNIYTLPDFAASGVLIFQSGVVLADHNTVSANDLGITSEDDFGTAAGSVTSYNLVRASTYDGISLFPGTNTTIDYNKSSQNSGPGIGLYDSNDNPLQHNVVDGNTDSGILLDNAGSNTVSNSEVMNNGTPSLDLTDGIRVNMLSMGNTLQNNQLRNNVTHDCHDDSFGGGTSGSGNFWVDNHGGTENRPGLCTGDPAATSLETTTTFGWDADYPWYNDFGVAADYDWAAAYATIDLSGLLQLLPQVRAGGIRRTTVSPGP